MGKIKRSISGIYFRYENPETEKWENWVFEDLPEEKQDEILNTKEPEFVKNLAKILADTLNRVCEQFDITATNE